MSTEIYNHFFEFQKFLDEQKWMAHHLRDEFSRRLNAAMSDAYTRGQKAHEAGEKANQLPYESIAVLPKVIVTRLRKLAKDPQTFILCIKQIRELTGEGLRESKDFAEKLRGLRRSR